MPLFASVPDTPQVVPLPPHTPDCYSRQASPAAASACVNEHPSAQVHKEAHESSCMHTQIQHIHSTGMGEHTAQMHQPATPPRKGRKNRAHAEPSAPAVVDVAPVSQQQPSKSTRETAAAADHTRAKAKRRVREALQHAELLQQRATPSTPEGTPTRKSSGRATPSMFIPGTPAAVTAAGATPPLAGGVGKDVLQMPSVLGGISVHSSSHVNLPSPRAPSASRFREFDPSAILGSITPSCVMTNTLSSRPGVNAATERTPLVGFLPSNSRILSSDEGASVASDQYTPVPIHRTLSLLHLESENSCAGRSGSTRTPLPCLLPRPPGSTTASVSTSNTTGSGAAPVMVAVPTSEKEPDSSAAATSVAAGGTSLAALFPSHADRLCSMAAARRSISSSNGSEWLTILGNSTANSLDVGLLGVPPVCPTSRPGPRGRRSRSGAAIGSLTSVGAAPCTYGSVTAASYGVSMLLDGTLLQSHCRISPSSSPTASHNTTATTTAMATTTTNTTTTSGGSYLTDTNTWSTNGSGTSCPSATLAATAGALLSPQRTHPFLAPSAKIATGNIVTSDVLPRLPATLPLPSEDSRISNSSGDTFTRNASAFSSGSTASPRRATSGPHTSLSTTAAARTATDFVTLTPSVTTTENASCDDEASVLMADRKTALLLVAAAPPRRSSTELVEASGVDSAACGPAGVASHMEAQSTSEVAAEPRKPSPPAVQEASASRHRFSESTASNLPVRMITVIPVFPPSGSATTPPLGDHFNTDAPLPQGMAREGTELDANHPSTVRWLTGTNPSFRGSPVGSMRSSLLQRAGPLPGRAGSSANAAPCGRAGSLPGTTQLQFVGEALLPSPRSGSLHSLLPACVPGWSVDDSVDVPLDACDTATATSMGTQKLDSLCPATESSLSTDASVFAGGSAECPHLTSAFFRQLNSFSRSRMSVTGGIGQRSVGGAGASRHSSIAVSKATSAANSVLTRTATAAAATTFVSSTTRTTTTTTTRTTSASTAAATAAACATQTSKAATTTVTTTAISSISCSSRQTIVALSAGGGEAAEEAVNGDIRSGLEGNPQDDTPAPAATQAVDSLLLDDPDAPPFAQAAMRHFREQDSHRGCCAARRTAETRTRDPSSSPRRAWAQSQSSHADGVVSYVVSAAAIESSCTAHSFMAEARCLNRSTAHAPPSPQGSMPSQSTALVGRHHTTTEEKATRPLKAEAPCVSGIDVVAVTPLSATEIHLPTLRPAEKRRSLWRVAGGFW